MARRVLVALGLLGLFCVWVVHADEPSADKSDKSDAKPAVTNADLALKKEIDARKFRELQQALLRLAQRLENSNKPEDRERAASIRKAIDLASTSGVDTRFDRLIGLLKKNKDLNLEEVTEAMNDTRMLVTDIRAILALLLSDNRDERLKAERERIAELIKRLDKAIRDEKTTRAQTEGGRAEKRDLADQERKNRKQVADIGKALEKKDDDKGSRVKTKNQKKDGKDEQDKEGKDAKGKGKDGKDGQSKSKEGKDGEGKGKEGKDGQGKDSKSGQGKEGQSKEGKDGQGKKSDGKQSKQGGQQGQQGQQGDKQDQQQQDDQKQQDNPNDPTPGQKQVQDAQKYQREAEDKIEKDQREEASKNQSKAIEELEKARKKLEEILRQLREEEIERLLAALQARCEKMLQMQVAVYNETVQVDKAFGPNPNKEAEANRGNVQKALDLSKREGLIVEEANKAIEILEAEGTAVAFPEVFHQVRDDMKAAERRLGRADVASVTQVIETDIINTLKDMIEALKKAQQDQQNRKQQQQQQQQSQRPQDQKLIDLIAELKMIRSMQIRVNGRTKAYGEQYTGEQASVPEIQQELSDLAERQHKIFDVTTNIAKGKNK